jgi:methylthioribose-1-phosphate isomerase
MSSLQAIRWDGECLHLLDQRRLPSEWIWLPLRSHIDVARAISEMVVRGAPAIAITAAYGMALAVREVADRDEASACLLAARPTAVNLRWALERISAIPDGQVEAEARRIHAEDLEINRSLGAHGAVFLEGGVLTICNTGALATGGHGTALGMVRSALELGRSLRVFALETRPYLQGARLTVAECAADRIPCTLITDGMAGALMASGRVDAVVIGCDRVAANGDTANKIGSYQLAVLAHHHEIPFYVAMPTSTLDRRCPTGAHIPVEERDPDELRRLAGVAITLSEAEVWNPAFDITPARLIRAWITERGVWHTPFPSG